MKNSTLMILVVGALAYLFLVNRTPVVTTLQNPVGGTPSAANGGGDPLWTSFFNAIAGVAGAVKTGIESQSQPKTI